MMKQLDEQAEEEELDSNRLQVDKYYSLNSCWIAS